MKKGNRLFLGGGRKEGEDIVTKQIGIIEKAIISHNIYGNCHNWTRLQH